MSVTVTPLQVSPLTVTALRVAVAPGPSDHGALSGLEDDDHLQYLNETRGDARYALLAHGHAIGDVAGLQAALDAKAPESHAHVVSELEPYAPTATYGFDLALIDLAGFGASQPRFSFAGSSHAWSNGPVEEPDYTDHVMSWGFNIKAGTLQQDASLPALCWTLESKFFQSPNFQAEMQLRFIKPDGTLVRPFAIDVPYSGAGRIGYTSLSRFNFKNEAGDTDAIVLRPEISLSSTTAMVTVNVPSGSVSGAQGLRVAYASAANTQVGFQINGNTSGILSSQFFNAGSGLTMFQLGVAGTNHAFFQFFKSGGQQWACGKNAADNFEIAAGSSPGSNTALTIDKTTRQAAFNAAPKLPSYTVAGLPSAATAGAGALAYVSDASGGPTLACSDGANWRVVAALGATVS